MTGTTEACGIPHHLNGASSSDEPIARNVSMPQSTLSNLACETVESLASALNSAETITSRLGVPPVGNGSESHGDSYRDSVELVMELSKRLEEAIGRIASTIG